MHRKGDFILYILKQKTSNGLNIKEWFQYLLWNESERIEYRIFNVTNHDDYNLPNIGQNTISE